MLEASTLLQNISLSSTSSRSFFLKIFSTKSNVILLGDETAKKLVASKGAVKHLIKAYDRLNAMISEDDGSGYNDFMSAQRRTSIAIANLLPYCKPR